MDADTRHDADLRRAVDLVGDRWTLLLVAALAAGPRRFAELSADLRGVAPNVLTDRLRRAERAGLLTAAAYQHRPRRHVYELTPGRRRAGHDPAGARRLVSPAQRLTERAPPHVWHAPGAAVVVPRVRDPRRPRRRRHLVLTRAVSASSGTRSRTSSTNGSGCSNAAKWPPRSSSFQWRMSVKRRSAQRRDGAEDLLREDRHAGRHGDRLVRRKSVPKLSQYRRADDAPVAGQPVEHHVVEHLVAAIAESGVPSLSVHAQNFSMIQAHCPAGESTSPYPRSGAAWTAASSSRCPSCGSGRAPRWRARSASVRSSPLRIGQHRWPC